MGTMDTDREHHIQSIMNCQQSKMSLQKSVHPFLSLMASVKLDLQKDAGVLDYIFKQSKEAQPSKSQSSQSEMEEFSRSVRVRWKIIPRRIKTAEYSDWRGNRATPSRTVKNLSGERESFETLVDCSEFSASPAETTYTW